MALFSGSVQFSEGINFLTNVQLIPTGERFGEFDGTFSDVELDAELDVTPPRGSRSSANATGIDQQTAGQQFAVSRQGYIRR